MEKQNHQKTIKTIVADLRAKGELDKEALLLLKNRRYIYLYFITFFLIIYSYQIWFSGDDSNFISIFLNKISAIILIVVSLYLYKNKHKYVNNKNIGELFNGKVLILYFVFFFLLWKSYHLWIGAGYENDIIFLGPKITALVYLILSIRYFITMYKDHNKQVYLYSFGEQATGEIVKFNPIGNLGYRIAWKVSFNFQPNNEEATINGKIERINVSGGIKGINLLNSKKDINFDSDFLLGEEVLVLYDPMNPSINTIYCSEREKYYGLKKNKIVTL